MTSTDLHSRTMCNVWEGSRGVSERVGKKDKKRTGASTQLNKGFSTEVAV
jgi:hypothetical protein